MGRVGARKFSGDGYGNAITMAWEVIFRSGEQSAEGREVVDVHTLYICVLYLRRGACVSLLVVACS